MKLVLINAESGKGGGPATIADDIYKNFVSDENEAVVAYGRQCGDDTDVRRYKIGGKLNLYTHGLLTRLFDQHGMGSIFSTKKLVRFLREYNPDVINLHNIHGYYLNYKILFKYLKESNVKVVWTLHDCWPFTGHCCYFDIIGCEKWKTHCKDCPQTNVYPASFIDTSYKTFERKMKLFNSIKDNLTIVTPSAWLGNLVKESFLKECQVEVINNGIDLKVFKPMPGDFKRTHNINKKMVLALASEWTKRKGFDDIIYVGQRLGEEYQLVMVGLQPEQIADVPSEIIAITRTDNIQQLIEIYSEADVFVNASVEDNFPTVILESLACGTPVVSYDTGGCKEEVTDACGIIVDKYDKEGLIESIKKLGEKTAQTKEACVARAMNFEKKNMYDKYNDLFQKIVENKYGNGF